MALEYWTTERDYFKKSMPSLIALNFHLYGINELMVSQWDDFATKQSSLGYVYSLVMTFSLALGGHHHTNLNFIKPASYMPLTWFS